MAHATSRTFARIAQIGHRRNDPPKDVRRGWHTAAIGRMMVGGKEPPVRHRSTLMALCLVLAIGSCSSVADPTPTTAITTLVPQTTTTTTTAIPPSATTSQTSTTTQPPETTTTTSFDGDFVPPQPFVAPLPTATGGGSGCVPGSGTLPDGVWFGFIDEISEDAIDFDLACFVACEPGTGFAIRNDNPVGRTVAVRDGAVVIFENPDGDDWFDTFDGYQGYEEADLHNDVWIYVNDNSVTHIVEPAAVRGCRSSAVDVEWLIELPRAASVAFNDVGLVASSNHSTGDNVFVDSQFFWRSSDWTKSDLLGSRAATGWYNWSVAGSTDSVGVGATISRWSGSMWLKDNFDTLGDGVQILGLSGSRVLMAGTSGDRAEAYVLTRSEDSWRTETIALGSAERWRTWSGAISGATFAVADTGMDTADGRGTVYVYDLEGTEWARTATIRDPWHTGDWGGNWGSALAMDGDLLVVGADGATPGSGTPGAIYAYHRTAEGWDEELVGEGGEGFGFGARIDDGTIVAAASSGDREATFWVFTVADAGWIGTPIQVPIDQGEVTDWVYGIDVDGDSVAVATESGLWIGRIIPIG